MNKVITPPPLMTDTIWIPEILNNYFLQKEDDGAICAFIKYDSYITSSNEQCTTWYIKLSGAWLTNVDNDIWGNWKPITNIRRTIINIKRLYQAGIIKRPDVPFHLNQGKAVDWNYKP